MINDLPNKILLLTGPRQSGKTTMSKQLNLSYDYFNMDNNADLDGIVNKRWDRTKELLLLDEFYKFNNWKRFVKGVYDTEGLTPKIIITGSAKLDTFKNVRDSLAGRYFQYRMYPIDLHEACNKLNLSKDEAFNRLSICGGFPEPFLIGDKKYYQKWQKTHTEIIIKEDIIDIAAVKSIKSISLLAELLRNRVSGNVNYLNLGSDLKVSPNSVKSWIELLENMYMFFRVTPYHNNIARSILKEPKIYTYDIASIKNEAAQLENLVALSLLKYLHYLEDSQGHNVSLHYCRTKDHREIDFLVKIDQNNYLIEVKTSDNNVSKHFSYFKKYFDNVKCIQLVKNIDREYSTADGIQVKSLIDWLANINLHLE